MAIQKALLKWQTTATSLKHISPDKLFAEYCQHELFNSKFLVLAIVKPNEFLKQAITIDNTCYVD